MKTHQWCQEPADCHMQALLVRGVHWSNLPTTGQKPPVILHWKPELEICPKVAMTLFSRLAPTKHDQIQGLKLVSHRSTIGDLKRQLARKKPPRRSRIQEPPMLTKAKKNTRSMQPAPPPALSTDVMASSTRDKIKRRANHLGLKFFTSASKRRLSRRLTAITPPAESRASGASGPLTPGVYTEVQFIAEQSAAHGRSEPVRSGATDSAPLCTGRPAAPVRSSTQPPVRS